MCIYIFSFTTKYSLSIYFEALLCPKYPNKNNFTLHIIPHKRMPSPYQFQNSNPHIQIIKHNMPFSNLSSLSLASPSAGSRRHLDMCVILPSFYTNGLPFLTPSLKFCFSFFYRFCFFAQCIFFRFLLFIPSTKLTQWKVKMISTDCKN